MNLLDENFPEDQSPLLRSWGIPFRRVGREVARLGTQDSDIIPVLHRLRRVTFFTQDRGFYNRLLCHTAYCLAWLDVAPDDTAYYVRRFLRHPRFGKQNDRMGLVVRVHHDRIQFFERNQLTARQLDWIDRE